MISDPLHPSDQELRSIDIHLLLPQQEPFVMINRLTHFDQEKTVTELLVKAENLFVENGRLTTEGLMENIAQTCAARIGFVNKFIMKEDIQIGFIGAVRNMEVMERPHVGDLIVTTVDVLEQVFGMTLAQAQVTCDGKVLATAEMKIAIKADEP